MSGPVDGARLLLAARRLREAGAQAVAVTRAAEPILVLTGEGHGDGEGFEVVPPRFPQGFREGCGDAMTGAIAASLARGRPLREALVVGAAAGSGNFLRHGLGTGKRRVVEELAAQVTIRPLERDSPAAPGGTPAAATPPGPGTPASANPPGPGTEA